MNTPHIENLASMKNANLYLKGTNLRLSSLSNYHIFFERIFPIKKELEYSVVVIKKGFSQRNSLELGYQVKYRSILQGSFFSSVTFSSAGGRYEKFEVLLF